MSSSITLRLADHGDAASLRTLAERDSAALPPGPHLVAERRGEIEAAISLTTSETVADPFKRTAELCELLRCAARQQAMTVERPAARPAARPLLRGRLA